MKIEKISEHQIKFILNKTDLTERNIKFSELEYGSEKTQELFHDMMEQANTDFGFVTESAPLMIEAIPITLDSIMVVVTKITDVEEIENKLSMFSNTTAFNISSDTMPTTGTKHKYTDYIPTTTSTSSGRSNVLIYAFATLDDVISISKQLINIYNGNSSVYKYQGEYYLVLEGRTVDKATYILNEYGKKYATNIKNKFLLSEHGETITAEYALEKYSSLRD